MSGLICHVTCPACGCTSPSIPLARHPWEPAEIVLPASNLVTGQLDVVVIAETEDIAGLPRDEVARRYSTSDHPVAAVVMRGDDLILKPPLPCPRGHALIELAVWGGAPPAMGPRASLDQILAETRTAADEMRFTSPDERYDVICDPEVDGALHEIRWRIRLRGDGERDRRDELRTIVAEVVERLKVAGSAVSEPDIRSRQARFTERFVNRT